MSKGIWIKFKSISHKYKNMLWMKLFYQKSIAIIILNVVTLVVFSLT